MNILITEDQYQYICLEEKKQIYWELYESLSEDKKQMVIEILKNIYPDKNINEAWYNTVGDFVGAFEPTGVVNFVNGLDYLRQKKWFFGFMSLLAALPLVGKIVGVPLAGLSATGKIIKRMDNVLDVAKTAEGAGQLAKSGVMIANISKGNKILTSLVNSVKSWGPKLFEFMKKVPEKFLSVGMRRIIGNWINAFLNAGDSIKSTVKTSGAVLKNKPSLSSNSNMSKDPLDSLLDDLF